MLPAQDLQEVLDRGPTWTALKKARILITGGTGFFGKWLLETLMFASETHDLGVEVVVLSRNPVPGTPRVGVYFETGDVRSFRPISGRFTHAILGAVSSNADLTRNQPDLITETIVEGTRNSIVGLQGAQVLFLSSGAVYGKQTVLRREEGPEPSRSDATGTAYSLGKWDAERLCAEASTRGLDIKIARCFAFVGPHLPLDRHFAIGNFIADGLAGRPISISGDGAPIRSFMYAADLAIWLWTILLQGRAGRAYNVGSEEPVTIRETAEKIAQLMNVEVLLATTPSGELGVGSRYVPDTSRARSELGLKNWTSLEQAIRKTIHWHRGIHRA